MMPSVLASAAAEVRDSGLAQIDIVFPFHNRAQFTQASLQALLQHTDWSLVRRLFIYDDRSSDRSAYYVDDLIEKLGRYARFDRVELIVGTFFSPVVVMLNYLKQQQPCRMWAKIDNDTCVPPGWLDVCRMTMLRRPELDLLGIEALDDIPRLSFTDHEPRGLLNSMEPGNTLGELVLSGATGVMTEARSYRRGKHVGGIGLFRTDAFERFDDLYQNGRYFGFTEWQHRHQPELVTGFLTPALPVCLLDRVPIEPWCTLADHYVERGWARAWPKYGPEQHELWDWLPTLGFPPG